MTAARLLGAAGLTFGLMLGGVGPAVADEADVVGGAALGRAGVVVDLPAGVPPPPALPVASYLLADLDTGEVLAARSAHARRLPASTLKVLTALVLLPRLAPTTTVLATDTDVAVDGTKVGMLPGSRYAVQLLFQAMLMASGNDAAYALARAGGGLPGTVAAMNAEAAELGAFDTVARDPSGLDAPGQSSSAYDLALIGRAAMQRNDFRGYVAMRQARFPGGRRPDGSVAKPFMIGNHNRLLYNYPGTIGVKNGYTVQALQTYIGAVRRGGRTLLLASMGGTTPSWRPPAAMFDWAFRYAARVRPVGTLVEPGTVTRPPATPAGTAAPAAAATPTASASAPPLSAAAAPLRGPGLAPRAAQRPPTGFLRLSVDDAVRPWLGAGAAVVVLLLAAALLTALAGLPGVRRRAD
ncbi:MAG TPA: serine hydrolase [Dermatophilaceae bacterium]|nr:serine hydrolase [Dermatophilaceae bacterium]